LHAVLPFAEDDFLTQRVTFGLPQLQGWRARYEALRGDLRFTHHFATTEEFLGDEVLYGFAARFMQGLALIRAAQAGAEAVLLALRALDGPGPISDDWAKLGGGAVRTIEMEAPARPPVPTTRPGLPSRTVKAMLFADVAGFAGLSE